MADNYQATQGSGTTFAADEVGGALYPRIKVAVGADGAAADLAPGRAAAASSLPAALSTEDLAAIQAITTKLSADPATQTTLAAILAKIIAAPATEAKQGAGLPAALGAGGGLKVDGSGTALPVSGTVAIGAGTATVGKVITPTFSLSDSITRPANATPYAANKSINCSVTVTAVSYSGLTVTLTAANALSVGDRITVAGINAAGTGFTNIDGNWTCKTGTNATTIVFDVAVQPTGTTPQSGLNVTGAVAKCLSFDVAGVVGGGVILSRISVAMAGVGMTGAVRAWIYTTQPTVLADQSTFTLLTANDIYRKDYIDLYPVTEGSGSDVTFASQRLWEVYKTEAADTRLYIRLSAEAAGTPASGGVVTVRLSGVQLLG